MNNEQLMQWVIDINSEPQAEDLRQNEKSAEQDKESYYIPISIVQSKLDEVFMGLWSWEFQDPIFGKTGLLGRGALSYKHPIANEWITRTGTAAIPYGTDIRMDYPRLEAMVLLNASKKIGISFGRNLNRDIDDAPMPVINLQTIKERDLAIDEVNAATTSKELSELFKKHSKYHKDKNFTDAVALKNKQFNLKTATNGQQQ